MTKIDDPLQVRSLSLANRIVMSPMTRTFSPSGVPNTDVADYYRRRAEGGTGLLVTEGVAIDHASSVDHPDVPRMFGRDALEGWRQVTDAVHAAGGRIIPQLWHVGPLWGVMAGGAVDPMRPSGLWGTPGVTMYSPDVVERLRTPTRSMTDDDIGAVINAYRGAARNAIEAGFDGIAIHGGHGYLLDSFLWADTNRRSDSWGGEAANRAAFPAAVVRAVREEIGNTLPIFYRFSQHKQQDFKARLAETPDELRALLEPLVSAGVDVLDASARKFDAPAFGDSALSLAGWAKRLTGARTMAVGGFGLPSSTRDSNPVDYCDHYRRLEHCLDTEEFDLIGIGRMHLADPLLAGRLQRKSELLTFDPRRHEAVLH